MIASVHEDGTLLVFNRRNAVAKPAKPPFHINDLAFLSDAYLLLACGTPNQPTQCVAQLWDIASAEVTDTFPGAAAPVTAIRPLNLRHFAAASTDRSLRIYNIHSPDPLQTFTADSPVTTLTLDSSGTWLAAGLANGEISLWQNRKEPPAYRLKMSQAPTADLQFANETLTFTDGTPAVYLSHPARSSTVEHFPSTLPALQATALDPQHVLVFSASRMEIYTLQ